VRSARLLTPLDLSKGIFLFLSVCASVGYRASSLRSLGHVVVPHVLHVLHVYLMLHHKLFKFLIFAVHFASFLLIVGIIMMTVNISKSEHNRAGPANGVTFGEFTIRSFTCALTFGNTVSENNSPACLSRGFEVSYTMDEDFPEPPASGNPNPECTKPKT
jgi:hypothetical protein